MMISLSSQPGLARLLLVCLFSFGAFSGVSQNAFTDGLSWVSGSPATTALSPVFSSPTCNNIQYTLSTTSALAFDYDPTAVNGSGVLFPAYSNNTGNTMLITITFNTPVTNFGMRILDLDEDNQHDGGIPEEYLSGVSPAPASATALNGINPVFLSGSTVTPNDGNASNANNNAGGWIYWTGQLTTVSFTYNRYESGYEFVLDSLHFECPCPDPSNHIDNATVCPNTASELNASTPNATAYLWNTGSTNAVIQADMPGTYWVNVYLGSCMETDTAVISQAQTPELDLGNDTTICEGASLALAISPLFTNVTWQDGTSSQLFTATTQGLYYASATYNSCPLSDTLLLTVNAYPVVDLGNDTYICEGSTYILTAPSPGYTYLWSNGSTASETEIASGGTIWVLVANGPCMSSDTVTIIAKPLPPNPLPGDMTICSGDTAAVTLSTTSGAAYEWFNGSTENTASISAAGNYWVESSLNGCSRTDTLHIGEYPSILENLAFDSVIVVCEDKSALIGPALGSSLIDLLWDNGSTHSTIYVNGAGIYGFTVSTPCESYTYSVRVEEEKCFCSVYLPNAFTPDNQFGNEVFGPVYECALDRYELLIFNRWGEIVFSSTDPDASWDGTFRGLPVPDGVYVYSLMYTSAETETYKELTGHVSVLR